MRYRRYLFNREEVENMTYNYDYSTLLGRLREKHITQSGLASMLGLSETSLNHKFKNKTEFRQSEISKICDCLDIPSEHIDTYFFNH